MIKRGPRWTEMVREWTEVNRDTDIRILELSQGIKKHNLLYGYNLKVGHETTT